MNQIKHKYRKTRFVSFSNMNLLQGWIESTDYLQYRFISPTVIFLICFPKVLTSDLFNVADELLP